MAVPTAPVAGSGVNAAAAASSIAVPWCAAVADRAVMIQLVIKDSGTDVVTTPSGWTLVRSGDIDSPKTGMQYIFKMNSTMTGAESGTVTINIAGGNDRKVARMYGFDGSNNVTENGVATVGNDTTVDAAALTTGGTNRLALQFVALFAATTIGPFTGESGGDWAEAFAEYNTVATLQLQTASMAAAGTITGGTVTPGAGGAYSCITVALQEFTAGGGGGGGSNVIRDQTMMGA